jgi:trimeric autotransporter adhesin
MANKDASQYTLRWNEILQQIEYAVGLNWAATPISAGGITQLTGQVTSGPGSGSQVATISANTITNAMINSAAAISLTKLAALNNNIVPVTNGSGFLTSSTTTTTQLGFLDATSSIQTQLNGKQATGNYITALTGDITATGPGSVAATLATVNGNVGAFTNANITVNAKGLITAAANGSSSGATVSAYSPTIVGLGTPTNVAFFYTTNGAAVSVWGTFKTATNTAVAVSVSVPLPIAAAHLSTDFAFVGDINFVDATAPRRVLYDGSDTANIYFWQESSGVAGNLPVKGQGTDFNNNTYISIDFSYPII